MAPAMPCKILKNCGSGVSDKRQNLRVFWKLVNPPECVWETRYQQITKTILQEKVRILTALQFGAQFYSYASSYEDSGSKSSGGQGMGKIGENFGVEFGESQKLEKGDR